MDSRKKPPTVHSLATSLKRDLILPFLDRSAILALAKTGRQYYTLFSEEGLYAHARLALKNLLSHGALGELEKAETIWKIFPDLLTCRGTIYHPNRIYVEGQPPVAIPFHQNPGSYKYNHTFYEILLMNSEFEEAEEVGKLMTHEEKLKQFKEVFPDGEIKKYNFDLEQAKELLQAVFEAVAKDERIEIEYNDEGDGHVKNIIVSDSTREALYKLYAYAKPKSEHEVGLVFDPEFYHEALKFYDEKSGQFGQNWDRYYFWNIRVEEWLAGCLGTGYLRQHALGPRNPSTRRGCVLADGTPYWPFRRPSNSVPGHHIYVGFHGRPPIEWRPAPTYACGGAPSLGFQSLCQTKKIAGQTLRGNIFEPKKDRHV